MRPNNVSSGGNPAPVYDPSEPGVNNKKKSQEPAPKKPTPSASKLPSAPESQSLLGILGSGADPALVIYAMLIRQKDEEVAAALDDVRQIHKVRDAINAELTRLKELRAEIIRDGNGDGDKKSVTKMAYNDVTPQYSSSDFVPGPDGVEKKDGAPLGGKDSRDDGHVSYTITLADVDKEINRLQNMGQSWDSDREIKMIGLNQSLNKKEQFVGVVTNILKSQHETAKAAFR
jgi:hypothetical protein